MAIASIFNVPSNESELASWAFAHQAHHRDINRAIYKLSTGSISVVEYIIDPVNPFDVGTWTYQHQDWHNRVNTILGTGGYDLTGVEFRDQAQSAGWIWLNGNEHTVWANLLGVG